MTPVNRPAREGIDRLPGIKAAAAAAQARVVAAFAASQRAGQRAAGVPVDRAGRGVAAQVGLARRQSPASSARYTGWAGSWSPSCRTPWPRSPGGRSRSGGR